VTDEKRKGLWRRVVATVWCSCSTIDFATKTTTTRANRLTSILLHTLLDKHMQLKDIQQPPDKELVDGQEILQTTPEVAKIEVMEAREEEGEEPTEVSIEIVRGAGDTRFCFALFSEESHVVFVGTNLF
jgi:hypothetical protein